MISAIRDEADLRSAQGALAYFEDMLRAVAPRAGESEARYRFEAEQLVYDILRIRRQIDDYIGLTDFARRYGLPPVEDDDRLRPLTPADGVNGHPPRSAPVPGPG